MKVGNIYGLKNTLSITTHFSYCSDHMNEQLNIPHTKKENKNNIERNTRPMICVAVG